MAVLALSDSVIIGEQTCTCEQLMLKSDCISNSNCQWKSDDLNVCIKKSPPSTLSSFTKYCKQFEQSPLACAKKEGCAYFQNSCQQFPGCSAYAQITTKECQAISIQCVSNEKECTEIQECPGYQTKIICESSPSKTGRKLCIWENDLCREEKCSDATYTTDAECDKWMSGCVSTGKGCINNLGYCSSYQGDNKTCETFIGLDGKCEGGIEPSDCKAKDCKNAPQTYKSDTECQTYQIGCITNGKGCVHPPLQQCQFYSIAECNGYIGLNGECQINTEGSLCIPRPCEEAPSQNKTDQECKQFRADCVTTGKGCSSKRESCSSYSGTVESCQGYIGKDGYCKGLSQEISPCTPILCQDAPQNFKTNEECNQHQIGCITNGKGCVTVLLPCSTYVGTIATCEGLIGSDGKCKGISSESISVCTPKVCEDAPINYVTNEECNSYQFGCVTNGKGCLEQKQCKNTVTELSCIGTQNCQWNGVCVNSSNCIDFKSASLCNNNLAGQGNDARQCYWAENNCRDLLCSDAPKEYTTDGQCAGFRKDCLTTGKGCISDQEPCSSYFGTQKICSQYTIKCWNISDATSHTPCTERKCSDNEVAKSDNECQQFKSECRFNGLGCIDSNLPCSSYQGEQEVCSKFKGNNGQTSCWNVLGATNTTPCINKECSQNTEATSDTECIEFLADCVTNGQGCLLKSAPCSAYSGTLEQCSSFIGTNGTKLCWLLGSKGQCIEKECSHAPNSLVTDNDCNNFMIGCRSNGRGCISKFEPCSSYTGTIEECSSFFGNEELCYSDDPCEDRQCVDVIKPINNDDCISYHSNCRYSKGQCINSRLCTEYQGTSIKECEYLTDNTLIQRRCWWTEGSNCTNRICENAPINVSNQSDCDNHLFGCLYNNNTKQCITRSSCSLYSAYGSNYFDKLNNCKQMFNMFGDQCWYSSEDATCSDKTCANVPMPILSQLDCNQHKQNCIFNGKSCYEKGTCSSYIVEGPELEKQYQCMLLKDLNNNQCYWHAGSYCSVQCTTFQDGFDRPCEIRNCRGYLQAQSKQECQNWLDGCQYIGRAGMFPCIEKKTYCDMVQLDDTNLSISDIAEICENMESIMSLCQISGDYKRCRSRTCSGANNRHSREDCNNWLSGCQWDGITRCVDPNFECPQITPTQDTLIIQQQFCESFVTVGGKRCQLRSDLASCEDRSCSGARQMSSQQECHDWLADCQWDGRWNSSCVAQQKNCSEIIILINAVDDVQKLTFCDSYITSSNSRCQFNLQKGSCEDRTCMGARGMLSKDDCHSWLSYCQWDGRYSCVDQAAVCETASIPIEIQDQATLQIFCNNYVATNGQKCSFDNQQCQIRQCSQANQKYSASDCNTWKLNCQWDGISSCVDQTESCPAIDSKYTQSVEKTLFCVNFVTTNNTKCQLSLDSNTCEERTCTGTLGMISQIDCDNWKIGCKWDRVQGCVEILPFCPSEIPSYITENMQLSQYCINFTTSSGIKCQPNLINRSCEERTCVEAFGVSSQTECENWKSNCVWDGIIFSSCVDQQRYCPEQFPIWISDDSKKQKFCENYQIRDNFHYLTITTSACQLKADKSGCEKRTCSGKQYSYSSDQCSSWLYGCVWDGQQNCIKRISGCPSVFPSIYKNQYTMVNLDQFCSQFSECYIRDDYSGCTNNIACEKIYSISSSFCQNKNCQWDGASSCVVQEASCPTQFPSQTISSQQKKQFCENYITSNQQKCQITIYYHKCEERTCDRAQNMYSSYDCYHWKQTCKWDGVLSCLEQEASCPTSFPSQTSSFLQKKQFCENYYISSNDFIECQVKIDYSGCEPRKCNGAFAKYSNNQCNEWKAMCLWDGASSCVDRESSCPTQFPSQTITLEQKKQFCENYYTSYQICQLKAGNEGCENRTCAGAYNMVSSTQCNIWKYYCQWDGVSRCIDQEASCPTQFPSQTITLEQKKQFCENYYTSYQICQLKAGNEGCENRTCAGASSINSQEDCQRWLSNCYWEGYPNQSCSNRLIVCENYFLLSTYTYAQKKQFCESQITSSNSKCQLKSDLSGCEARTCEGGTSLFSNYQCQSWKWECVWNTASSCIDRLSECPQNLPTQADTISKKTDFCNDYELYSLEKCQLKSDQSGCEARTCSGASDMYEPQQCSNWKYQCQWNGVSSCVDQLDMCPPALPVQTQAIYSQIETKKAFCELFQVKNSQFQCQLRYDQTRCEIRLCTGAYGINSTYDCYLWKANCQWDGSSSCVDQVQQCSDIDLFNITNKHIFCQMFITSSASSRCQLKSDQTGCEDRTCAGGSQKVEVFKFQQWKSTCMNFDGNNIYIDIYGDICPEYFPIQIDTDSKKYWFCYQYITRLGEKCQLKSDLTKCETRTCLGARYMNDQSCQYWKANCQWDGVSSCVDQSAVCPPIFGMPPQAISTVQKLNFCQSFITSTNDNCQLSTDNSHCETRTCMGAYNMSSQQDCNNWKLNCQWDGMSRCLDQLADCPGQDIVLAIVPIGQKQNFCESYITSKHTSRCQLKLDLTSCENRACNGAIGMKSQSDCNNWLTNCEWDGFTSCIDCYDQSQQRQACACAHGMNSTEDCNNWKSTCQWDGKLNSSCLNQQPSCSFILYGYSREQKRLFCQSYIPTTRVKCQLTASEAACEDRTCEGVIGINFQKDCDNWLENCKWDGIPNSTCYNCAYQQSQRICVCASGMSSYSDCYNWKSTCQWDGVENSSCVESTSECPFDLTSQPSVSNKKQFCESFRTIEQGRCQLRMDQTRCENRTCAGATGMNSQTDCIQWKSDCIWNGNGCVDYICLGSCKTRQCSSAVGMNSTQDCQNWNSSCQWDGKQNSSCLDQSASCQTAIDQFTVFNPQPSYTQLKAFCESYVTASGIRCQLNWSQSACEDRTCLRASKINSQKDCDEWLRSCQWVGFYSEDSSCVDQTARCSIVVPAFITTYLQKKSFCENFTTTDNAKCQLASDTLICEPRQCLGASARYSSNECYLWLATCQWDGIDGCEQQTPSCPNTFSKQTILAEKINYCNNYQTTFGQKCQLKTDESGCEPRTCSGKQYSYSQNDCTQWMSICRFDGISSCIDATLCDYYSISQSANSKQICESLLDVNQNLCQMKLGSCNGKGLCSGYLAYGDSDYAKRINCNNQVSITEQKCTYIDGNACSDRSCSNSEPQTNKETCEQWLQSCIWDGERCLQQGQCQSYLALGVGNQRQTYCLNLFDNSLPKQQCTYDYVQSAAYCTTRTCSNIPFMPNTNQDCMNYLNECRISYTKPLRTCITRESECSAFYGSPDQCKSMLGGRDTKPCWSISQEDSYCISRTCTHNTTSASEFECNQFMAGCKFSGRGCIPSNVTCSDQMGDQHKCPLRKAGDGINYCKPGQKTVKKCRAKTCLDDVKSTTDEQCQKFLKSCVTRGQGCISRLEPCSSYRGTQEFCSQFTGTNGTQKCWNSPQSTITTPCRERFCSDDQQSETNEYCQDFLQGCVTKGKGCIDIKDPCSAYVGTQDICSHYKGLNGTKPCWNLSTSISSTCRNKECEFNISATTDSECDAFISRVSGSQSPTCVTNGKGCVTYPKKCSDFIGTQQQCEQFTAIDGPCKSTVSKGSSICAQKQCQEASNTHRTDPQCKEYHPSCVTNGYGCMLASQQRNCQDIQSQNACQEKSACKWVSDCQRIEMDCSHLTSQGASACVNMTVENGLKKCSWRNNQCNQESCLDLPDELTTHQACQARMPSCTTKGIGCIEMGPCSTYLMESTCKSAQTTDPGNTCIWSDNKCIAKQCSDATAETDSECNAFLAGCKTNGIQCINSEFVCSQLITELVCVKDSNERPCFWRQGACQNYSKCDDIQYSTHEECQKFLTQCTTDGTKCIPITSCENMKLQISCQVGRDGKCGWLPPKGEMSGKCQKFGECNDAVYQSTLECQQYSKACISDGESCIDKSSCSSYKSEIACDSGGTDGICVFKMNQCQLRTCSDADSQNAQAINTHEGCYQFRANEKCTANGTSCIPLGQCDSYGNETGCRIGTDGLCIWNEEKCRLKNCNDFEFKTNEECQAVSLIQICISDGLKCIEQTYCAKYNTREACRGGGIDGICVFISTSTSDPNAGKCKLMTQCKDANIDEEACRARSDACYWNEQPLGSVLKTSCDPHTCSSIAVGTICKPIPDFEKTSFEICILNAKNDQCVEGERSQLLVSNCYSDSMGTYMWNTTSNECKACFRSNVPEVTQLDAQTMNENVLHLFLMVTCIILQI